MEFKKNDLVYVNGLKGIITDIRPENDQYLIKFMNDKERWYPEQKLIRRYPHCEKCNRRMSSRNKLCKYCRGK